MRISDFIETDDYVRTSDFIGTDDSVRTSDYVRATNYGGPTTIYITGL